MPQYHITSIPVNVSQTLTQPGLITNSGNAPLYLGESTTVAPGNAGIVLLPRQAMNWRSGELFAVTAPGDVSELSMQYGADTSMSPVTTIDGPVVVEGDVGISGPVVVTGEVGLTGPVDINGDVSISGPVNVNGTVEIGNDVNIVGGGQLLYAGNMTTVTGGTAPDLNISQSLGARKYNTLRINFSPNSVASGMSVVGYVVYLGNSVVAEGMFWGGVQASSDPSWFVLGNINQHNLFFPNTDDGNIVVRLSQLVGPGATYSVRVTGDNAAASNLSSNLPKLIYSAQRNYVGVPAMAGGTSVFLPSSHVPYELRLSAGSGAGIQGANYFEYSPYTFGGSGLLVQGSVQANRYSGTPLLAAGEATYFQVGGYGRCGFVGFRSSTTDSTAQLTINPLV